jgi:hypothetical protein
VILKLLAIKFHQAAGSLESAAHHHAAANLPTPTYIIDGLMHLQTHP